MYYLKGGTIMKRNKLLIIILGIAIFSAFTCSSLIIVNGIKEGKKIFTNTASPKRLNYPKPYILEKTKLNEFSEATIDLDYSNISIIPSDDYYLEYRLDGTCTEPEYNVSNGAFHFKEGYVQQKYRFSLNFFGSPSHTEPYYLNLYVPKEHYFNLLKLISDSGNINLEQINAKKAEISAEYGNLTLGTLNAENCNVIADSGNIDLKTLTCNDLTISAEYGNITGDTITVSKDAKLTLDSGNLTLSQLTADMLKISNEYGNCSIDQITVKSSTISMDSGNLNFKNASLGNTSIDSEYGEISLALTEDTSNYNYDITAEYGTLLIDGKKIKENEDGNVIYQKQNNQNKNTLYIHCDSGNIYLK